MHKINKVNKEIADSVTGILSGWIADTNAERL